MVSVVKQYEQDAEEAERLGLGWRGIEIDETGKTYLYMGTHPDKPIDEDLGEKPCKCGHKVAEVINAEQGYRVGWWCPKCSDFDKAVGRERKYVRIPT